MPIANIRVVFDPDSNNPTVVERNIEFTDIREPRGREFVAEMAASELQKEAIYGGYYRALPSVEIFHRQVKQTFNLNDIVSGTHEDRLNTRAMWMEMGHTLLRTKYLLAQSRAYHDREQTYLSSGHSEAENLSWHTHLDKMERFDLAVFMIGRISDLTARLIFERLGASLIPNLDRSDPEWERGVDLTRVRKGLQNRTHNSHVASLTNEQYAELLRILDEFHVSEHVERLWDYRVRLAHRITPSVDRSELYTHLQSRARTPIKNESGKVVGVKGNFGESRAVAEFSFLDLYVDAVQSLAHSVSMLNRLEAVPPFGIDAKAFSASG